MPVAHPAKPHAPLARIFWTGLVCVARCNLGCSFTLLKGLDITLNRKVGSAVGGKKTIRFQLQKRAGKRVEFNPADL
jgi:hypothetical protein